MYIRFGEIFHGMTPDEKKVLAALLSTSLMTLRHYAAGRYRMSAERAIQCTHALQKMGYPDAKPHWCRPDLYESTWKTIT